VLSFLHRALAGARVGVGAASGLWIGDVVTLAFTRGGATWRQWFTGLGAALFVAVTAAFVLGALLGPVVGPAAKRLGPALRDGWLSLREAGPDASQDLAARALTVAILPAIWSLFTYRIVLEILFGFARPDTMTVAMTFSHAVFAATLVLAWPWGLRVARAFVDAAAEVRGFRWFMGRPCPVPVLLVAVLLFVVGAVMVIHREVLGAVP
jgi:hypothetical protein